MTNESILRAALFTPGLDGRWGLPINFKGKPGVGKSSVISALARANNLHCEVVIASLREPADFLGLPIPSEDGSVAYAPPSWAKRANDAGQALVFLDELNTAPPAVQAALLRCVLEGAVGDLQLPPGVRFVAAQNSAADAAGGHDLAAPLANRFGHVAWPAPSADAWIDWMLSSHSPAKQTGTQDPSEVEEYVMHHWSERFSEAKGLVTAFLRAKPSLIHQMPEPDDPQRSGAWPSPRTWEMATRAVASAKIHGLGDEETAAFISSFLGGGAGTELLTFARKQDLPSPKDVLDGKVEVDTEDKRLDRLMGIVSACVSYLVEVEDRRDERSAVFWQLCAKVAARGTDLIYPGMVSVHRSAPRDVRNQICAVDDCGVIAMVGQLLESVRADGSIEN